MVVVDEQIPVDDVSGLGEGPQFHGYLMAAGSVKGGYDYPDSLCGKTYVHYYMYRTDIKIE